MLIYLFNPANGTQETELLLVVYNICNAFLSSTPVPFINITKWQKDTKSSIFITMCEYFSPHYKTQPSRLTVGQLDIPKKVQVNF